MEEFKNLKEIIELCNEELDKNDINVNATLDLEDLKELQNLINKYNEQEDMIDYMIDFIRNRSIYYVDSHEQLKDYFRKKAKGD